MPTCINPMCRKEFEPKTQYENSKRTDNRPQIWCSKKCQIDFKKKWTWNLLSEHREFNEERKGSGHYKFRDPEDCDIDPPLPVEAAYANYLRVCAPNPPTYDFEDWYDLHLTYGGINW